MKTPQFFYIDISGCSEEVKAPFGGMLKIPVVEGRFFSDFDVLEDELPVDVCNFFRHESEESRLHLNFLVQIAGYAIADDIDFMPIGVDKFTLPPGAIIVER